MVDLGQKRWKEFHLFYWNKVREKRLEVNKKRGCFKSILKQPLFCLIQQLRIKRYVWG